MRRFALRKTGFMAALLQELMTFEFKHAPCPLCKGTNRSQPAISMVFKIGANPKADVDVGHLVSDGCPHCCGTGRICLPPFGDGLKAKIPEEKMSQLAEAATLLRCIDHPLFVEAVANQAAYITLPDEVIETFVAYWANPERDVNLGEYIKQIAEYAEDLAMASYGTLSNGFFAGPRQHKATSQ